MSAIIQFTVWLVAFMAVWRLWKRTVRDSVRDRLFDLRDEWRAHWADAGLDMSHPHYGYMRNEINSYLRSTAQWRMLDSWYLAKNQKRINAVVAEYRQRRKVVPAAPDSETSAMAVRMRADAVESLRAYMLLTSVAIFPLVVVVFAALAVKTLTWDSALRRAVAWVGNAVHVGRSSVIENAVLIGDGQFSAAL